MSPMLQARPVLFGRAMNKPPTPVQLMIQKWIKKQNDAGVSLVEIGRRLGGMTHAHMSTVRDGLKCAGPDLQQAFANLFYGGSIDRMREAAVAGSGPKSPNPAVNAELQHVVDFRRGQFPDAFLDEYLQIEAKSVDALTRDEYLKDIDAKYARWRGKTGSARKRVGHDELDDPPPGPSRGRH